MPSHARREAPALSCPAHRGRSLAVLALAMQLALLAPDASADELSPDGIQAEIAELKARLARLEALLAETSGTGAGEVPPATVVAPVAAPAAAPAVAAAPAPAVAAVPEEPAVSLGERGLAIRKGDFEMRLRGGMQLDHQAFLDGGGAVDETFRFRRIRPTLEGSLGPLVAFRITPELAEDTTTLLDAWIDLRFDPRASLRVGRMKGPVSLERQVSFSALPMIERGFASELAPNREVGAQLFGRFADGRVNYALGVFNGAADGRSASASDPDGLAEVQGRLFFEPWKGSDSALAGLGFGLAGTSGNKEGVGNAFLPRYRSPGQQVVFAYRGGVAADGRHRRWMPQAYYYNGPFGLMAEYIESRQAVADAGGSGTELTHEAWTLTGSWLLTGEKAGFSGPGAPAATFSPSAGDWGAFELVGRIAELRTDPDAFPVYADPDAAVERARELGLGLNWYLTSNLKLQFNLTRTQFDGGGPAGSDREDETTFFSRVQIAY